MRCTPSLCTFTQLLLLFLLPDPRLLRPCRATPAHARAACASAPRLPRHHVRLRHPFQRRQALGSTPALVSPVCRHAAVARLCLRPHTASGLAPRCRTPPARWARAPPAFAPTPAPRDPAPAEPPCTALPRALQPAAGALLLGPPAPRACSSSPGAARHRSLSSAPRLRPRSSSASAPPAWSRSRAASLPPACPASARLCSPMRVRRARAEPLHAPAALLRLRRAPTWIRPSPALCCSPDLLPHGEEEGRQGKRSTAGGRRKEGDAREKRNRGEREKRLPKDLCAILENCRDLSVKHKFLINLKP
jgi:hypothetical protein